MAAVIEFDGDRYEMDDLGHWSGPDEMTVAVLEHYLDRPRLSVMPAGVMVFDMVVTDLKESGKPFRVVEEPEYEPIPPDEIS